jgi:hypothetical protein
MCDFLGKIMFLQDATQSYLGGHEFLSGEPKHLMIRLIRWLRAEMPHLDRYHFS